MLEHDDAEVTVRFNGRQDEDRAEPRVAAGLVQQEQSKIVEVLGGSTWRRSAIVAPLTSRWLSISTRPGSPAACMSIALIVFLNVTVSP